MLEINKIHNYNCLDGLKLLDNCSVDCIKAGCPPNGIVLDPFMGSGTTGVVARKLYRNFIGFELNPKYIKIADQRLYNELGMFL